MGRHWYDFKTICSSDYAIMVTNKGIKETHRPGSTKEDVKEKMHSSIGEEDEDLLDAPLHKEDVEWLLDRAPEYNAYQIGESFVLFTKGQNDMREAPCLEVPGPYEIEEEYRLIRFHIEEAPKGELYTELFELAGKFTPSGSKLSFPPGKYSFATTDSWLLKVKQLKRWSNYNTTVPLDFELIVGNGDKMKIIGVNRALLLCCFPHIETRFGDALTDTKLELPKLDPQAVESLLGAFSSRHQVRMPYWSREQRAFYKVRCAFGNSTIEIAKKKLPDDRTRLEHPAMADPRWLDASFLCGPQREEIKVNRAVLASMNPVLHGVLFGTDLIPVDPSKPIEWPDFDAQAVRYVFLALLHCGKKEFVVPLESVESVKMLVDYLVETREALMLYYDTPFKREYQGRYTLRRGKDGDGLLFSYD